MPISAEGHLFDLARLGQALEQCKALPCHCLSLVSAIGIVKSHAVNTQALGHIQTFGVDGGCSLKSQFGHLQGPRQLVHLHVQIPEHDEQLHACMRAFHGLRAGRLRRMIE